MDQFAVKVRTWGPAACFTRPEFKVERVSYEVMTPGAARGLIESIFWEPEIRWSVRKIHVLKPIQFISIRRNEVSSMARGTPIDVESDRIQRYTLALRDVEYVIEAEGRIGRAPTDGSVLEKYQAMFERRLEKGQWFRQPYFGCREFTAYVEPVERIPDVDASLRGVRPLGKLFLGYDYRGLPKPPIPRFFDAELTNGVLAAKGQNFIPDPMEVAA